MKQIVKYAALVFATAGTVAFAQVSSNPAASTKSGGSAVAYVYVSSSPSSGVSQINAYSASSSGVLTPVAGSPFDLGSEGVSQLAVNGKYLFGSANYQDIYSFSIASDGALQQVSVIDASNDNSGGYGGPGALFLDHTGVTLYDADNLGAGDNAYQAFSIDQSTGQLNFLQETPDGGVIEDVAMSFIANNLYTYGASCYEGSGNIFGYARNSDGTLTGLNINPTIPAAPKGEGGYCPYLTAPDPNGNLAVTMEPNNDITPSGPVQIAVYTADSEGNLTTTSTAENMPKTKAGPTYGINDIWMSPSGQLLAVGGTSGLQVFHFNGPNPVTKYTGLLTKDEIDQLFWDNDNHLYALSRAAGLLYVFTVTPTSHSQAKGSPYTITGAENIQVLPE